MSRPAPVSACRDVDGYAPIGDYAVIGDGRGVALIAPDGSIDWWAAPDLDSTPAFAALLDPQRGGRIELRPADDTAEVVRRYVPNTNVLESTYSTAAGRVKVTDSLNSGTAGLLPWSELARRVEGLDGAVEMVATVTAGDGLHSWEPWVADDERGPILHAGDLTLAVRCSDGVDLDVRRKTVRATVTVPAGDSAMIAIVAAHAQPLLLADVDAIDHRLDECATAWRRWAGQVRWDGPRRGQVVRSALALKLLLMTRTGAIAAAATTSLPERIGGPKNWDYRFSWVRDAALTIDALSSCGLTEEVHAAVAWLLDTVERNGPDVHVMYTLTGDRPESSSHAAVPGYKHSQPVMVGNTASGQVQLGVYGDLFSTVADWVFGGHVLDVATARLLADLADRCADVWRHDDAGIWELHDNKPYTSSKMNCWRALDRAARLADSGHISGPDGRWRAEADLIREWVDEHCWSDRKQAYTFYAGTEDLDASVLLGAAFGFEQGPRMASTVAAISAELGVGPLVYRYSGVDREEESFIACAYWRVEALARLGRREEAEELMHDLDSIASPLGLLSEMCTPGTNQLVGNIPQALSHLALISAARALLAMDDDRAQTPPPDAALPGGR